MIVGDLYEICRAVESLVIGGNRKGLLVTGGFDPEWVREQLALECCGYEPTVFDLERYFSRVQQREINSRIDAWRAAFPEGRLRIVTDLEPCDPDTEVFLVTDDYRDNVRLLSKLMEGEQDLAKVVFQCNFAFGLRRFVHRTRCPLHMRYDDLFPIFKPFLSDLSWIARLNQLNYKSVMPEGFRSRLGKESIRYLSGFCSLVWVYLKDNEYSPEAAEFVDRVLKLKTPESCRFKAYLLAHLILFHSSLLDRYFPLGIVRNKTAFVREDDMLFAAPRDDFENWLFNYSRNLCPDSDPREVRRNLKFLRYNLRSPLAGVCDEYGHNAVWYVLLQSASTDIRPILDVYKDFQLNLSTPDSFGLTLDDILSALKETERFADY